MVNAEKHRMRLKGNYIDIYFPGPFESWLKDFYGETRKDSFAIYWGGINGAIHKKLNKWNPEEETWFKHEDGLLYAESANEIMEDDLQYTFVGMESRATELWTMSQYFLEDIDIYPLFVDINDYIVDNELNISFFNEIIGYDIVFIKNMTVSLQLFLLDNGITKCIDYVYFFLTEDESMELMDGVDEEGIHIIKGVA